MLKNLLLLLLLLAVWWAWKHKDKGDGRTGGSAPAEPRPPERMVRCAHCGVHLPENDALRAGGEYFCNDSHRRAGSRSED